MNSRSIGILLAAVGAGLIWLFRKKGHELLGQEFKREIILKSRSDGSCGIVSEPEPVELRRSGADVVHWVVINPAHGGCGPSVRVCIDGWRTADRSADPPVKIREKCQEVRPGHRKTITGVVRPTADDGTYYYDVLIDGEVALDPIVRIVL